MICPTCHAQAPSKGRRYCDRGHPMKRMVDAAPLPTPPFLAPPLLLLTQLPRPPLPEIKIDIPLGQPTRPMKMLTQDTREDLVDNLLEVLRTLPTEITLRSDPAMPALSAVALGDPPEIVVHPDTLEAMAPHLTPTD